MIGVGVGATLAVLVLSSLVTVSILRQMGGDPAYASEIARQIAEGQLNVDVQVAEQDRLCQVIAGSARNDAARTIGTPSSTVSVMSTAGSSRVMVARKSVTTRPSATGASLTDS